jgi:hypothetical protein
MPRYHCFLIALLLFTLATGCQPSPAPTEITAIEQDATPSYTPESTATPTHSPSPSPTSTNTSTPTPPPTDTMTPTPKPSPTPTTVPSLTPSNTPLPTDTPTPRPTPTPLLDLTPGDVGLPFDPSLVRPALTPCYLFTDQLFHAGDIIEFSATEGPTFFALAPIEGKIIQNELVTAEIGYEITVETPYVYQGGRVYYDMVHSSGLVPGLNVGDWIERGEEIVVMDRHLGGPGEHIFLDLGIRNGPKGANPTLSNWQPYSYFSFLEFVQDDLQQLPPDSYQITPPCSGVQISEENLKKITPVAQDSTEGAVPTGTPSPIHGDTSEAGFNKANFVPPVDPHVVPLYNAFDLDPTEGVVEPQSASYPPRTDHFCDGQFFFPRTPDNHFAWDYGTGNCSKHLVGTPINGMSVGFLGEVTSVSFDSPKYPIRVDYGLIQCTDGQVRHIEIQFAHSLPNVKVGDMVSSETTVAHLEEVSTEIEIKVFGDGGDIDPRLIGLELP